MKRMLTEKRVRSSYLCSKRIYRCRNFQKIYVTPRRISTIINHIKEKWHINSRVELGILVYHYGFIDAPLFSNKENHLFEKVAQ